MAADFNVMIVMIIIVRNDDYPVSFGRTDVGQKERASIFEQIINMNDDSPSGAQLTRPAVLSLRCGT